MIRGQMAADGQVRSGQTRKTTSFSQVPEKQELQLVRPETPPVAAKRLVGAGEFMRSSSFTESLKGESVPVMNRSRQAVIRGKEHAPR